MPQPQDLLSTSWLLLCAILVLLMQAGFTILERGQGHSKNGTDVAAKNLIGFCVSAAVFWAFGYAAMFGATAGGLVGTSGFLFGRDTTPWLTAFFLYQLALCGIATAIASTGVASRIRLSGYVALSLVISGLIYPIAGHWARGGLASGALTGWLGRRGFVDFAGATVVHMVGGTVALAALLITGPRDVLSQKPGVSGPSRNTSLSVLGILLLWTGWLGFNGGSTLALNNQIPQIWANTILAGVFGGLAALALSWWLLNLPNPESAMQGILAGGVGITASAHIMTPAAAASIGAIAGLISIGATRFLSKLNVDDPVGAVSIHLFAGAWGTLAVGVFGNPETWPTGLGRWEQLVIQLVGLLTYLTYAFGVSAALLWLMSRWRPLRAGDEAAPADSDAPQHSGSQELLELLNEMEQHRRTGDVSRRVSANSNTEVGQIAQQYNRVLDRISAETKKRKEAIRALRATEERFRLIINTAHDAVVTIDADGLITGWNPQAEKIFGWSRYEAIGRPLSETILPHEYREQHEHGLKRFLRTGEGPIFNRRIETTSLHRDGHKFPVEITVSPLESNGVYTFSAFIRDITERKQAEAELRQAKEAAETAATAKSEFLANMSHEIRTPMNGIIGMTDLALDTDLTHEQREYLSLVKSSAEALLAVINDILDFSKIEAGKLDLEFIKFDLRDSLAETTKTLALRAHEKGIELAYHVPSEVPDALIGDPGRLRQIIVNLVGNAIKFTEVGEVVVRVQVESEGEDDVLLHFTVVDTGVGIPPEKQATIFEAFQQADGSTTRKYGGTGLGLTISAQLVEMMGGRIWVESVINEGSQFHFTARFGIQSDRETRPIPVWPANLDGLPVLVVDDNATNRHILEEMLEDWHMKPTCVNSGAAALAALHEAQNQGTPFAFALVDALMPEMDGFALIEQIKQHPELASIVIMMLTSAGTRDEAARCRALGVDAYLRKPITQSDLLDTIMTVLSQAAPSDLARSGSARQPTSHRSGTAAGSETGPASDTVRNANILGSQNGSVQTDRHHRILLVEDNAVNQKLACRILEKRGHHVTVANNGREALDVLDRESFDVVLMDVQMPEMDGFEATAAIREDEKQAGTHVPIVAMTAHAMKGDRERCLAAGMDSYVSKPIKAQELFATIEELIPTKPETETHKIGG